MSESTVRYASLAIVGVSAAAASAALDSTVVLSVGVCLAILVDRLWCDDNVPVFLFPLVFQWLQVATKPLQMLFTGVPINSLSKYGSPLEPAVFLSLACLAAMAVGIRTGLGNVPRTQRIALVAAVRTWSTSHATAVCVSLIALGSAANAVGNLIAPLRQPLLAVASIQYAGLFLLAFWSTSTGRGKGILAGVVVLEVMSGLTGYFADFRGTLVTVLLGVLAGRPDFRPRAVVVFGLLSAVTLFVAVFWTAVKGDYRDWVSGGEGAQQVVARPLSERIDYMVSAAQNLDGTTLEKGLDSLISRLSYVDFIAAVLLRVPEIIPHQDGRQVGEAVYHVLTPRVLFPDKPPVPDDTQVAEYYTGIPLTVNADATSISIGYVGELYIDFGFAGAIIAAGLFGLGLGWAVRMIAFRPDNGALITYGSLIVIAVPLNVFEIALIKFVGATVTALLAVWFLGWFGRSRTVRQLMASGRSFRGALPRRPGQ